MLLVIYSVCIVVVLCYCGIVLLVMYSVRIVMVLYCSGIVALCYCVIGIQYCGGIDNNILCPLWCHTDGC